MPCRIASSPSLRYARRSDTCHTERRLCVAHRRGIEVQKILSLVVLSLVTAPLAADAKTLYVDRVNGNDARSYSDNSSSTPWASLGRAVWGSVNRSSPNSGEAARAGDVVLVAGGTYGEGSASGSSGVSPLYNPVNGGTSSSQLVIRCVTVGACVLTSSNYEGPLVGSYDRDYVEWDGFTINEASTNQRPDSGIAIIRDADSVTLRNLTLIGSAGNWGGTNHNGIRIEFSTNCHVVNNEISGLTGDNGPNDTGLTLYVSNRCVIENNYIHDNRGAQVIEKTGTNNGNLWTYDNVFRFNVLEGGGSAVYISGGGARSTYHQNVFRRSGNCVTLAPLVASTGTLTDYTFANNVFVGCSYGIYSGGTNRDGTATFWNNIFTGNSRVYVDEGTAVGPSRYTFEHNSYYGYGVFATVSGANYSLDQWRNNWRQDAQAPASMVVDPLLASILSFNYRLLPGSPVVALGRAIRNIGGANGSTIPAGVYITGNEVIGRAGGSNLPRTVTGLRIIGFD